VVKVAEELIEAVHRGQELVQIAQMIFSKLTSGITERLQQLGNGRILRLKPDGRGRNTNLGEPGPIAALASDERGTTRSAGLFAVAIGETHSFLCDPVNIWRLIAHHSAAVARQVPNADVVAPDHQNIRFFFCLLCHLLSPFA
jgi:hypothetical protein